LNSATHVICESNLSRAWGKIFLEAMDSNVSALNPITLCIDQLNNAPPKEDDQIRAALDKTLNDHEKKSCNETAATIFPYKTWIRMKSPNCEDFTSFYLNEYLPRHAARVKVNNGKFKETYFSRMIKARGTRSIKGTEHIQDRYQLAYIISQWRQNPARRPRHSSLMVSCFDPVKDQIGMAQGGFPCLHEVSFGYDDQGQLSVNAFYPTEYIFERAYGNYLGLCQLGLFMAREMDLKLTRFNCFIGRPERSSLTKEALSELETIVKLRIEATESQS